VKHRLPSPRPQARWRVLAPPAPLKEPIRGVRRCLGILLATLCLGGGAQAPFEVDRAPERPGGSVVPLPVPYPLPVPAPPPPPAPVLRAPAEAPTTAPTTPPTKIGRDWQVPRWVMAGILKVETRSILRADDSVKYVDKRRGLAGERGPTQLKRIAFDQVARPGEQFWKVEVDHEFAMDITERYLLWLKARTGSWEGAVKAYNAGPGSWRSAGTYLSAVRRAARALGVT
jgi:hypothetical protein